jgi:UDP-GlcNAc:undecaprenyl-phosphate GlcNAc-1-phosphate transferase
MTTLPFASLVEAALAGALALLLALYIAPIVIRAARKYGIVDKPSTELKTQKEPVPYLGGVVLFVALLLALSFSVDFDARVLALLLCASIIVSLGLVDDLGTLVPRDKLIGQVVAAFMLVRAGVHIEILAWPSPLDEIITVLWLVTCMNAFNILDVSDGLAATAALLGCVGVGLLAALHANPLLFSLATTVGGATLGFLWFNRAPARIYLGDTGSMLLGTLLGIMVMLSRFSDTNDFAPFIAPLALLALPLFDLSLVVVARLYARRPVWFGSPDHFAVRLRDHGHSANRVAIGSGAIGLVFVAGAVLSTRVGLMGAVLVLGLLTLFGLTLLGWILWRFPSRDSSRFTAGGRQRGHHDDVPAEGALKSSASQ